MIPRSRRWFTLCFVLLGTLAVQARAQDVVYAVSTHPWPPFWNWTSDGTVTQASITQWGKALDHVQALGCTAVRLDVRMNSAGTAPDPQIIQMVNMVKARGLKLMPTLNRSSTFDYWSNRNYARVMAQWFRDNAVPIVLYQFGNEEDRACHIGLDTGNPSGDGSSPNDYDTTKVKLRMDTQITAYRQGVLQDAYAGQPLPASCIGMSITSNHVPSGFLEKVQSLNNGYLWGVSTIGLQVYDDGFTRYDQTRAKITQLFTGSQTKKIFITEFNQPGGVGSVSLYAPAAEYVSLYSAAYIQRTPNLTGLCLYALADDYPTLMWGVTKSDFTPKQPFYAEWAKTAKRTVTGTTDVYIEAEDYDNTTGLAPLVVGSSSTASGGYYLWAPEGANSSSYTTSGVAEYKFSVDHTGPVDIELLVQPLLTAGPYGGDDSFFLEVLDRVNGTTIVVPVAWNGQVNTGEWKWYKWQDNLTLPRGGYTLKVYQREGGTRLDRIRILNQ